MKKVIPALLLTALITGCATQTYVLSNQGDAKPEHNKLQNFFVGGLGQEASVQADQVCGSAQQVAKIQTEQTFINGLLANISYGIYTPRQMRVYCK